MDREEIFQYVKARYGTEPDYPWHDDNAVLRHKENRKWYGLVMEVGRDKLGLKGSGRVDVINLKSDSALIGSLRTRPGFHPAYHMNKDQWVTLRLDGSVAKDELKSLLDLSFQLTGPKRKRTSTPCASIPDNF
ncbi:MAG: MmcQ/YjbR family DNA-binding protein [Lachnospiraceae bacterium]|jgi:predicted DNA-binding protein (MmcQ/YjbR family)|nr:MmcQ/YjbR family DNA-binding protein [Lachnospiraceae bacterium]MCI9096992.1 MmcQ/YjbR family DNA-binding protein [Lachnospiraceae bacterium]MCI9203256.1 MmcQ/YjbR family DNA-binding protein [Lachnospiraceae bacterium]